MKYIKGLDALRAIAVFIVIFWHWGPQLIILPNGRSGVDLFFVLSGFLITNILLLQKTLIEGNNQKLKVIRNFMIRRVLRLFPIYYFILGILFTLNFEEIRERIAYYSTYNSNFLVFKTTFWSRFSHTWSLAVEEQFYLIWPWTIICIPKKYLLAAITSFFVFGVISTFSLQLLAGEMSFVLPYTCLPAFIIGAFYAYSLQHAKFSKSFKNTLKILFPISLIFILAHTIRLIHLPSGELRLFNSVVSIKIIARIVEARYSKLEGLIVNNRFLNHLGKISYGIYLYHPLTKTLYDYVQKNILVSLSPNSLMSIFLSNHKVSYAINLILVYVISYLSYNWIEKTVLNFKSRFEYTSYLA